MIRLILAFILATTAVARAQEISQLPAAQVVNTTDFFPCDQVGSPIVLWRCTVSQLLTNPVIIVNNQPRMFLGVGADTADPFTSPDSLALGGLMAGVGASQTIRCQPYGPLDLGTCFSLVMTDRPIFGSRAGIAPNGGAQTATYPDFDAVNLYNQVENMQPRFVASASVSDANGNSHVVTYDAYHAYFSPSLPPEWVALLRTNMHLLTNSLDGVTRPRTPAVNGRLPINQYAGQLLSWAADGSSVTVDEWIVPGGGASSGSVPGNTYDTVRSHYTTPTVFFGAPTKAFNRNTACIFQALPPTAVGAAGYANNPNGNLQSQVRECEADEIDLTDNIPGDYQYSLHGITLTFGVGQTPNSSGTGTHATLPTSDSYLLNLYGGGQMPVVEYLQGSSTAGGYTIQGDTLAVGSAASPAQWAGVITYNVMSDIQSYIDSDRIMLTSWLERDEGGVAGNQAGSLHLAERLNGSLGNSTPGPQAAPDGTIEGQIIFGGPANEGGVTICAFGPVCGFLETNTGTVVMPNGLTVSNGGANITGNVTFYQQVHVGGAFVDQSLPPATSSGACTQGQITWDSNYVYVCYATNTWKRTALATF